MDFASTIFRAFPRNFRRQATQGCSLYSFVLPIYGSSTGYDPEFVWSETCIEDGNERFSHLVAQSVTGITPKHDLHTEITKGLRHGRVAVNNSLSIILLSLALTTTGFCQNDGLQASPGPTSASQVPANDSGWHVAWVPGYVWVSLRSRSGRVVFLSSDYGIGLEKMNLMKGP